MDRKLLPVFAVIFIAVVALLVTGYVLFLRQDYSTLYQDLREADAAQIVAELDKQGIDYRLEDDGHRILVPEADLGRARVLIAGSDVAMGGVVGFELFNETDMGLTDFAQKVNYQRALQGELARTIMTMDGIEFARVHLSLPERALFRASQQEPKAAVTIQTEHAQRLDPARVRGIQQLVSSAVVDLPASKVAVLDHLGRLLSAPDSDRDQPVELSEKAALEEYYRARARGVVEKLMPGLPFEIRVLAIATTSAAAPVSAETPESPEQTEETKQDKPAADQRNFQLRISFRTESALDAEDQSTLNDAIGQATGLSPARGDSLRFETGPLGQDANPRGELASASTESYDPAPAEPLRSSPTPFRSWPAELLKGNRWMWAVLALLTLTALLTIRRRGRLSAQEQQSFAEMLGDTIAMRREASDER